MQNVFAVCHTVWARVVPNIDAGPVPWDSDRARPSRIMPPPHVLPRRIVVLRWTVQAYVRRDPPEKFVHSRSSEYWHGFPTVSEINGDFGRKSQFSQAPCRVFNVAVDGFDSDFGAQQTGMILDQPLNLSEWNTQRTTCDILKFTMHNSASTQNVLKVSRL